MGLHATMAIPSSRHVLRVSTSGLDIQHKEAVFSLVGRDGMHGMGTADS